MNSIARYVPRIAGLVTLSAFAWVLPGEAHAQAHTSTAADSLRQIQHISPTFGPAGTTVELSTLNLPVQARVHIGYGATRTGFEALFEVQQGMWGDVEAELTVPTTAPWDRAIVFVAFNAIFSPIGLSEPFHVVNSDGLVRRTGAVTVGSGDCFTLRDQDGYEYSLTGDIVHTLSSGAEVVVDGRYAPTEACGAPNSIAVVAVRPGR